MKDILKSFVNHWCDVSMFLSGFVALVAVLCPLAITTKLLLLSIIFLLLHFYEEFAWPGGFPYMGVKLLLGSNEKDPAKWNCNHLSSMYGNWGFLLLIYVLPLFVPSLQVLTLAAMMFNFAELLMHLLMFNVRLRKCYNPGMITAVFGLTPVSIYYFTQVFNASMFAWYHYAIAVVWFIAVFWLCFRSPIYWGLGKKDGYPFSEQAAFGLFEH